MEPSIPKNKFKIGDKVRINKKEFTSRLIVYDWDRDEYMDKIHTVQSILVDIKSSTNLYILEGSPIHLWWPENCLIKSQWKLVKLLYETREKFNKLITNVREL